MALVVLRSIRNAHLSISLTWVVDYVVVLVYVHCIWNRATS